MADHVYIMDNFDISGYTVIILEHEQPFVHRIPGSIQENIATVESLTKDIPHVRIPDLCDRAPERTHIFSPDGQYYAIVPNGSHPPVRIYTRDGQLVAQARKSGWFPIILGWAHDSSGLYFQTKIDGSAASMLSPYQPIFKLSPLTPEEQRSALLWSAATWAGGIGVVGGAGWWLWRRRRRNTNPHSSI
jgi:LPXTG-motif cell wall-anchored protein